VGDAQPSDAAPLNGLGAALRGLRRSRGLSLAEVADATAISRSFLSLVETGRSDITIGRLTRLVQFYGISITDLVPEAAAGSRIVVRRGTERRLHSAAEGIDFLLLAGAAKEERTMLPMTVAFEPGAALAEPGRHACDEFVHVIEGMLHLEVEGEPRLTLHAGDSAYYSADRPHRFLNASPTRPLRIICVNSPPPF
jgi:transcriptional regulator with XRE-family HTH domain